MIVNLAGSIGNLVIAGDYFAYFSETFKLLYLSLSIFVEQSAFDFVVGKD